MTSHPMLFSPLLLVATVLAQDGQSPPAANPALRLELLARLAQDQAIRDELIPKGLEHLTEDDKGRWLAIDADNTARMKVVLQQYGWPGPELVGRDGTEAAFVLVQHADYTLQKEALPLVRNAYLTGSLKGQDFALLQDRVLVKEGKPQIYGTQFKITGQELIPDPIEDEQNVDRRRAEVGLPSLAEYLAFARRMYFEKKP
jgi:uncharacterized protein DUF6624